MSNKKEVLNKEIILGKYQFKKDVVLILSFIFFTVLFELLVFLFLHFGIFPKYILFNISYLIFTSFILFAIPNFRVKKILILILLTTQGVLNCINTSLYSLFGDFFSFDMLSVGAEAIIAINFTVFDWWAILTFTALMVAVYFFYNKYHKYTPYESIPINKRTTLLLIFVMAISIILGTGINRLGYLSISKSTGDNYIDEEYEYTDLDLYNSLQFKVSSYKKFGTFGFYIKNLANTLSIETNNKRKKNIKDTVDYLTNSEYAKIINSGNYFGVSKGNNVISILMESFDSFGVDPVTTPTLYSLISNDSRLDKSLVKTDGFHQSLSNNTLFLSEFYGRNKTNQAESLSMVGNFAKETQFSRNLRPVDFNTKLRFDYSLPNKIKSDRGAENVVSSYFLGDTSSMYGRDGYLNLFGIDNQYFTNNADIGDKKPSNFYDFIVEQKFVNAQKDNMIPVLEDDKTFYTQYSTITTHGDYTINRNRLEKMGYYDILDEEYSEGKTNFDYAIDYINKYYSGFFDINSDMVYRKAIRTYKAAMIDLDRAIQLLFEDLYAKGLQDKTTVILYADHYAYFNNLGGSVRGLNGNEFQVSSLYNIPCMIFDTKLASAYKENNSGKLENTNFASAHNIVPTMLDILGIKYNSAFYTGYSVLNEDANKTGYVSLMNGILDNNFFTFDLKEILYKKESATDEDYARYVANAKTFLYKQQFVEYLYKYNILQYIDSNRA